MPAVSIANLLLYRFNFQLVSVILAR